MMDTGSFQNLEIVGGFKIARVRFVSGRRVDAIGREALAKTSIVGRRFEIVICSPLSDEELSVTIYHEILEAATIASDAAPEGVRMFNEGDFERAAYRAHAQLGEASAATIDRMLQSYGFR
jgi:hypothetical protein